MGMNNKLGTDEQVVLHLRTHAKALVRPVLVLFATAIAVALAIVVINTLSDQAQLQQILYIVLAVLFLGILIAFVIRPWLIWLTTTYTFTNRRIITQRGIITRSGHDLPLTRINDVSYDKSLLDRVFGCGTLKLTTAAEDPVILDDIPNIERVHVTISDLLFSDRLPPAQPRDPRGNAPRTDDF